MDPHGAGEVEARLEVLLADSLTERGVAQWLASPNRLLGGRRPSELLEEGHGDEVLAAAAESFVAGDYV